MKTKENYVAYTGNNNLLFSNGPNKNLPLHEHKRINKYEKKKKEQKCPEI